MPSISEALVEPLQQRLNLVRAVETGAYRGEGALRLAKFLPDVVTVELSPHYAAVATEATQGVGHVRVVQGHSVDVLPQLVDSSKATLWFLDGHWSVGDTAGEGDECPVLREIAATAGGHPDDVVVVDDARLFFVSPPEPLNPDQWPSLVEVIDALRGVHPHHHVTVVNDQIIAVPSRARTALDHYAATLPVEVPPLRTALRLLVGAASHRAQSLFRRG